MRPRPDSAYREVGLQLLPLALSLSKCEEVVHPAFGRGVRTAPHLLAAEQASVVRIVHVCLSLVSGHELPRGLLAWLPRSTGGLSM